MNPANAHWTQQQTKRSSSVLTVVVANDAKQCPAFAKYIKINEEKKKENTTKKQHAHSKHQLSTNTQSSQQPKQMSDLFKSSHTNTRMNSYTNSVGPTHKRTDQRAVETTVFLFIWNSNSEQCLNL